ncbi:MAG: PIN domain nuclease [Pseudonocardiaceae bacterium]
MAVADHLVDKSAWARLAKPAVAQVVLPLLNAGRLAVCGMTELEVLYSVRSAHEHRRVRQELRGLERLATPDEVWDRAVEVHSALAERGQHRSVAIPDLIIAAVAERHEISVLHYDRDFDVIAEVTGQPVEWVVPPGTAE